MDAPWWTIATKQIGTTYSFYTTRNEGLPQRVAANPSGGMAHCACWLSRILQAGILGVVEAVSGEVEAQDRDGDRRPGGEGGPESGQQVLVAVREHHAPLGRRRLSAQIPSILARRLQVSHLPLRGSPGRSAKTPRWGGWPASGSARFAHPSRAQPSHTHAP